MYHSCIFPTLSTSNAKEIMNALKKSAGYSNDQQTPHHQLALI